MATLSLIERQSAVIIILSANLRIFMRAEGNTLQLLSQSTSSPGSCGWRWPRPVWAAAAVDSGGPRRRTWTPSARASAALWHHTGSAHGGVLMERGLIQYMVDRLRCCVCCSHHASLPFIHDRPSFLFSFKYPPVMFFMSLEAVVVAKQPTGLALHSYNNVWFITRV